MSTKYQIMRVTGEGEQIHIEAIVPDGVVRSGPAAVHEYLSKAVYEPCDMRLRESSRRILDAMGFVNQIKDPSIRAAAHFLATQVLSMVYGRNPQAGIPQEVIEADKAAQAAELAKLGERDNVIEGPWGKEKIEPTEPAPA